MPNKMERFTQRSNMSLSLAQAIANELNHRMIHSGHLLFALLTTEGSISQHVLQLLGLDSEQLEQYLRDEITYEAKPADSPVISLSEDVSESLKAAMDEARNMGDHFIGTEHLLLGVLSVAECQPIIEHFALIPSDIRHQIYQLRNDTTSTSSNIGFIESIRRMFRKKKNDE